MVSTTDTSHVILPLIPWPFIFWCGLSYHRLEWVAHCLIHSQPKGRLRVSRGRPRKSPISYHLLQQISDILFLHGQLLHGIQGFCHPWSTITHLLNGFFLFSGHAKLHSSLIWHNMHSVKWHPAFLSKNGCFRWHSLQVCKLLTISG